MIEANHFFDRLEALVHSAIRAASSVAERQSHTQLLAFLAELRRTQALLPQLKDRLGELQEQVELLGEPPLQYGVFLGLCPECGESGAEAQPQRERMWERVEQLLASAIAREPDERERKGLEATRDALREIRGQIDTKRDLVVGVHGQRYEVNLASKSLDAAKLSEGQQVVLNKLMNVVGARAHQLRGDTAEVANIISPSGCARVTAIPDQPGKLQVRWAGGERGDKFDVACEEGLRKTLRRGDIVQLDAAGEAALDKVRPRLHVRSGGSEGIVVEISDQLFAEGVQIGDMVRVDTHLQFAFEKLPSYETGELTLEEVPDVTFADIGGLDDQIEEIRDAIELPYLHRWLFDEYKLARTKGIILYGPPGCGKTMIAKAIANSLTESIRDHLSGLKERIALYIRLRQRPTDHALLERYRQMQTELAAQGPVGPAAVDANLALAQLRDDMRMNDIDPDAAEEALHRIEDVLNRENGVRSFFLNVKGPELLSKWVGESEHRIRKIFEEAKRTATYYTPVVIFFDEMEAMFRARGSGRSSDVETTIVPQFLSEMDGVESSENVIVIGASNRHDMIDPAIMRPGRLDVKIKVERPDREAARKILALNLTPDLPLRADGLKRGPEFHSRTLVFKQRVVERTIAVSGANIPADQRQMLLKVIPPTRDVRSAQEQGAGLAAFQGNAQLWAVVQDAARREQLAEALINEVTDLIFNPASQLEVVTGSGRHHFIALREFVSGALLTGLVSRAKKSAVKRRAAQRDVAAGISFYDVRRALEEEFGQNADQWAAHALERELAPPAPGQPADTIQFVEAQLGEVVDDPWGLEKPRPYLN